MNEKFSESDTLKSNVNNYLHYGYLPPEEIPKFCLELPHQDKVPTEVSLTATIELFDEVFREAIEKSKGSGFCIVPLSGGWDSRILLGYALEHFPAHQIKTYTFGSQGQLDYEIGKKVARTAGVEHTAFDLERVTLEWDHLKSSTRKTPWTYPMDSFFNKYCYSEMQSGADFILSGFMGDPLIGGHTYEVNGTDVKRIFTASQQLVKKSPLTLPSYDPVESLPDLPENTIFLDHQLFDLGVRQANCTAPILTYKVRWDRWGTDMGFVDGSKTAIITPFIDPRWIGYWLSVPETFKRKRALYLDFLNAKFPRLWNIASKDYYGARNDQGPLHFLMKKKYHGKILLNRKFPHRFSAPKEMVNYLDYDKAFRKRDDYQEILSRAFSFLEARNLIEGFHPAPLIDQHMNYTRNHSRLFLVLIGLALNLQIEEEESVYPA